MKCHLSFIAFIAFVAAQGIQDDTGYENGAEDAYPISNWVPAPSGGYSGQPPDMVVPTTKPSEVASDDLCSTVFTTITTTRTVSIVTEIPSSLLSVTGIIELSTFLSPQPLPSTSTTGIIEPSSGEPPQPSTSAITVVIPVSSVTNILESSVASPQIPYPTASGKPISTTVVGTTSYTSTTSGLPVFTDAADAVRVPVVVAGVLGWAALVL